MGAAILEQDGLSDWVSFRLLKLPKKERREENLYFSCGTVILLTNRSFAKRLPLFCHVPILNISSAVAETKHKIIFIIKVYKIF
jgi:hypothetical protein